MTLRQLRGFLGITGYCCIWIPGYGELAQPLYKLLAETPVLLLGKSHGRRSLVGCRLWGHKELDTTE